MFWILQIMVWEMDKYYANLIDYLGALNSALTPNDSIENAHQSLYNRNL